MDLTEEHRELIEKLVKASPKYSGNEDLFDDFCAETCEKSYLIMQAISDVTVLENYLKKVVTSAIIDVLKSNGRVERTSDGYVAINEISLNVVESNDITSVTVSTNDSVANSAITSYINLDNIKDPRESIEEQVIRKDILENIIEKVKQINNERPKEMFLKIFYLRYYLHKKQKDIAQEVGISQAEVSKRLVNLSQLIKEKLY